MPRTPKLASDLTTAVRRALFWPSATTRMTDAEFLTIANELIGGDLYPALKESRGDLLTSVWDIPLHHGSAFDEPTGYPMPDQGLIPVESVHYIGGDGQEHPLERVDEFEYHRWMARDSWTSTVQRPKYFAFRGGHLHVLPHPQTAETGARVRVRMLARPLKLAAYASPCYYVRINADPSLQSGYVRFSVVDAGFLSGAWGTNPGTYDLIALSVAPPHIPVDWYAAANTVINEASDYIEVATSNWTRGATQTAVPGRASGSDFIVANYQTPIIQLPEEAYKTLLDGVVADVAGTLKDRDKAQRYDKRYQEGLEKLAMKVAPRAQGQPEVLVNHGSSTRLRMNGGWRYGG